MSRLVPGCASAHPILIGLLSQLVGSDLHGFSTSRAAVSRRLDSSPAPEGSLHLPRPKGELDAARGDAATASLGAEERVTKLEPFTVPTLPRPEPPKHGHQ